MLRNLLTLLLLSATAVATVRSVQFAQPTDEHKQLVEGAGVWEGTITTFMPDLPSEPAPAKETVVAIGSFWVQSTFECEFMGMPYTGTGCLGYDPDKGKYVGTWIDSTSTFMNVMEGEMDKKKGALVMRWEAPDHASGEKVAHRSETVQTKDSYTSTFYMGEGEGTKTMTIAMKRSAKKTLEAGSVR